MTRSVSWLRLTAILIPLSLVLLIFIAPRSPAQENYSGTFASFSPTQLGANGIALPASGGSNSTNIIDMRGVHQMTLIVNCTQSYSVNATIYDEGGAPSAHAGINLVNGVGADITTVISMGSESNVNASVGTLGTVLTRFPQRAMSFSFVNNSAITGTCTARLFVQ